MGTPQRRTCDAVRCHARAGSELRQPPRLEAARNGRVLFSSVHTTCHRNLRLEKTEMQGSWTVSAAPHQQTEAIGAAAIDSAELAKGRMLPAARWKRGGHGENLTLRGLTWTHGRRAKGPNFKFLPPTWSALRWRQLPIGRALSSPSRQRLGVTPRASGAAPPG